MFAGDQGAVQSRYLSWAGGRDRVTDGQAHGDVAGGSGGQEPNRLTSFCCGAVINGRGEEDDSKDDGAEGVGIGYWRGGEDAGLCWRAIAKAWSRVRQGQ